MVRGVLQDRHHELCIVRSGNSKSDRTILFFSNRDEAVTRGAGDYWDKCFTLSELVPQFLQPVADKVVT